MHDLQYIAVLSLSFNLFHILRRTAAYDQLSAQQKTACAVGCKARSTAVGTAGLKGLEHGKTAVLQSWWPKWEKVGAATLTLKQRSGSELFGNPFLTGGPGGGEF
jgi:hypothetical protein